ncbi:MAG: DUF222 domain-containing protein [Nocardioides sp.]
MQEPQALETMSEEQILDFADACADAQRQAETDLLRAAYQWAVAHNPDRLDPATSAKPGREKAKRLGGPGVPWVTEFAPAAFGARIGRSPYAASRLIADAQDLHHRHPELWSRVQGGEVRASYARFVTSKTRELSRDEAGYVDAAVAESADGRIPWSRFEALVEAKVIAAAPALAKAREERASRASFAKRLRGEAHGMASFLIRADLATIEQIEAAVAVRAERLIETMPGADLDQRRLRAILLMANPGTPSDSDLADLLPTVKLYVHTYAGPPTYTADGHETGRIARVEGHGPVTEDWIRRVLGPSAKFKIEPVFDLEGQAPIDSYEIPSRHRQAVHLMTPADTFPHANCLSRKKQVDHTVPYDQDGESAVGNYGPMTTYHHRIKTHGRWQVRQPFPGIYVWRDPHGAFYLVDHTGTRRVPAQEGGPSSPADPSVIELYRSHVLLEYDAA